MHINKIISLKQKCEKIQTYYGTYEKYINKEKFVSDTPSPTVNSKGCQNAI